MKLFLYAFAVSFLAVHAVRIINQIIKTSPF